jgi:hypothetical protein
MLALAQWLECGDDLIFALGSPKPVYKAFARLKQALMFK